MKSIDASEARNKRLKWAKKQRRIFLRLLHTPETSMHFKHVTKLIDFIMTISNLFSFFKLDKRFKSYDHFFVRRDNFIFLCVPVRTLYSCPKNTRECTL